MRKDELLTLRDRVLKIIEPVIRKKHLPIPQPDARPYPQDVEGELFWVDRLTYPGKWPHTGYGDASPPVPGLRYETWYFQKRETCLLALLCEDRPVLEPLVQSLTPTFKAFVEDGKYARRYRTVEDRSPEASLILRIEPNSRGIWRSAPLHEEKLAKALETMVMDTYPSVSQAVKRADPNGELPATFKAAIGMRDPLEELQARFNRR
jgi:hypothetical protein